MYPLIYYFVSNYTSAYLLAILFAIYYLFILSDPSPKAGIYSQPGKWFLLKYGLFRLLLALRKWQSKRNETTSSVSSGYGMRSRSCIELMDTVQSIHTPMGVDAVYFNACDKHGTYLIAAVARRADNIVQAEYILRLPGKGLFVLPEFPKTAMEGKPNAYATEYFSITPVSPMKTWSIDYDGVIRSISDNQEYNASIHLTWQACTDYFDFDVDMSPSASARAIAREPWSRQFFKTLKDAHQTHYEQFGDVTGEINIDSVTLDGPINVELRGARDHSYGQIRDWKGLHRYALNYIHLSDGTCICASIISYPGIGLTFFEMGYVMMPDGAKIPVDYCSFPLHCIGEDGNPPKLFSFEFTAGGTEYEVHAEVIDRPVFYMGPEFEGKVWEQMCRYRVNGISGWGCSEFEYRNITGKIDEVTASAA